MSTFAELLDWERVAENALAFAVADPQPISPGHTLVLLKRETASWFETTKKDRLALFELIDQVKAELDQQLHPDGYNVGFDTGNAAGQSAGYLCVHVIPRFRGDSDPRAGMRRLLPSGEHPRPRRSKARALATGGVDDPFARHVLPLLGRATDVTILAAFVQGSGVDRIRAGVQQALERSARVRLLTGDYLGITQVDALETLFDWQRASQIDDIIDDEAEPTARGSLELRVIETHKLPPRVRSFHPKSWRLEGENFATAFVGSSNLSRAALDSGIEWNLRIDKHADPRGYQEVVESFERLWQTATRIDAAWLAEYAAKARERPAPAPPAEFLHQEVRPLPKPHQAQQEALDKLRRAREADQTRALIILATGLGKTLVSVLDYAQFWDEVCTGESPPRLLFLAHRRELLLQAAQRFRALLRERGARATVGWFAENTGELHADLVFASVAKLAREKHLAALRDHRFDYVVVDEVHHAAAASYRKILAALDPTFLLGLTATPERADGADIRGLFDEHVAHQAGIDVGIQLGRLVPFHYFGIRDDIDYASIPWRNRRFDPASLTAAAQTEARMSTLWAAWQKHPGKRTIVFCCSVAHAEFVKAWLSQRGVVTRAIHSGPEADERSQALIDLAAGDVDAVCAVDVLNEGVDVPAVDRVVMLRPTESSVVFLQQLGRGLRVHDRKSALVVIDFVGNHKVFLERLRTLLSLGSQSPGAAVTTLLEGGMPKLPPGCSVDLELEAKDLLRHLFRATGADPVEQAYRELAATRLARPRAGELFRMGYSPVAIRKRHASWWDFVASEGDLSSEESAVLESVGDFPRHLETAKIASLALITLQAMVDLEALSPDGGPLDELAVHTHRVLRRYPKILKQIPSRLRDAKAGQDPEWDAYWREHGLAPWVASRRFAIRQDRLHLNAHLAPELLGDLAEMLLEMTDFRLAQQRGGGVADEGTAFECKVTWNKRDPILKLTKHAPRGELDVRLPDGSIWTFRFAKEFCNVARRAGTQANGLPDLLRGWFGPSAGHPGTTFLVRFALSPDGWTIRPVRNAEILRIARKAIPSYPDLKMAAGHGLVSSTAHEATDVLLPLEPSPDLFAVRVTGSSMDGGSSPIRDGDWAVFRTARKEGLASVTGRVVLVQIPEDDGYAFVLKRLCESADGWQLVSDNPAVPPLDAPEDATVLAKLYRAVRPESLGPRAGAVLAEDELASAFGLDVLDATTRRWGGHLFVFIEPGELASASETARGTELRAAGETAYILTRLEDGWRYLGVGRFHEPTGRWRFPELDLATWKELGGKSVSRPLPEGASARAQAAIDALLQLDQAGRTVDKGAGVLGLVTGKTQKGGVRLGSPENKFKSRTISLTDIAWVTVADADVRQHGGLLDESRVNQLRYLEGTPKGSTRWIDTGWAIALYRRALESLPSDVLQVCDDNGQPLDARFQVHRGNEGFELVYFSSGGTKGSRAARNLDYARGFPLLLERLLRADASITDAQVDSEPARKLPVEARRLQADTLRYPLTQFDPKPTARALTTAAAQVGRKPGAKGSGNSRKQLRLWFTLPTETTPREAARALESSTKGPPE